METFIEAKSLIENGVGARKARQRRRDRVSLVYAKTKTNTVTPQDIISRQELVGI